jgi:hypothetical protein
MSAEVRGGPGKIVGEAYVVERADTLEDAVAAIRRRIEERYGTGSVVEEGVRQRITHEGRRYELWTAKPYGQPYQYLWFDITQPLAANAEATTAPHRTQSGTIKKVGE